MVRKTLAVASLIALTATGAMASWQSITATTPRAGTLNSVHDMRGYAGTGADITVGTIDQQRVCAFCHTPHHAIQDATLDYNPLWSHQVNTANFTAYQSTTMNSTTYVGSNGADNLIGPSRLCMSCHDGTIAVDTHYATTGNTKLQQNDNFNSPDVGYGAVGGGHDLSNDHPIGFDYNAVAAGTAANTPGTSTNPAQDNWIVQATSGLTYISNPDNLKVADRLYQPQGFPSVGIMTCATCHDVHNRKNADNNGLTYLVLAPQKDSALCLTCHIK